jgi:flagellar biosynthesis chaperone FliJ
MKHTLPPCSRTEVRKAKEITPELCGQSLRACEEAARRIRAASDELASAWTALGAGLAAGVSATDLLRRRAWCNVLELRLKERAHELEDARQGVDQLWKELLLSRRAQELFGRLLPKDPGGCGADSGFSHLARTALSLAAERRAAARLKK